jgi:hypothetical protein
VSVLKLIKSGYFSPGDFIVELIATIFFGLWQHLQLVIFAQAALASADAG